MVQTVGMTFHWLSNVVISRMLSCLVFALESNIQEWLKMKCFSNGANDHMSSIHARPLVASSVYSSRVSQVTRIRARDRSNDAFSAHVLSSDGSCCQKATEKPMMIHAGGSIREEEPIFPQRNEKAGGSIAERGFPVIPENLMDSPRERVHPPEPIFLIHVKF
jgi:hypothetical protein